MRFLVTGTSLHTNHKGAIMAQGIRVKAVTMQGEGRVVGYYNLHRIREGEEFVIDNMSAFSKRWMILLEKPSPEGAKKAGKPTPAQAAGRREMDADDRI